MAKHRADEMPVISDNEFEHDDSSIYARVDPAQFPLYDERDSTLIEDPGAPTTG